MPQIIIGLLIGIAAGVVQYILLFKFITSITGGKASSKTVIFAITQFFFPFVILVLCALFWDTSLMWIGIGMAAALIVSAIIKSVFISKSAK